MKKENVCFCFPEVIAENEALLRCLLELLIVTLMAPHMSIQGAKKWGILDQSTSNCYKRIEEIGKMLINRKISLEDFLHNLNAVTTISDGTLVRRIGKKVYAAKKLKNYVKGNYGVYQDMVRNAKRYKGENFITAIKLINHKKRHLSKPEELVRAMKKGIVKAGAWLVIDAGLKSVSVLRQARKSGVKLVTRFSSNFVVERFGKEYRKEDILRDIKPIKRVINGKSCTIYQFKRCIWHGTMGNLFLINAEGYTKYLPLFTTALNSKPETIIMNYEERFSIEVTIKELKSYLCRESNYFEGKESNYGYIFILCLAYNFIHYLRLYIPDMSFKDILDGLSAYLLWKKPPKSAVLIEGALKGVCGYNGCEESNRLDNSILDAIVLSVETTA